MRGRIPGLQSRSIVPLIAWGCGDSLPPDFGAGPRCSTWNISGNEPKPGNVPRGTKSIPAQFGMGPDSEWAAGSRQSTQNCGSFPPSGPFVAGQDSATFSASKPFPCMRLPHSLSFRLWALSTARPRFSTAQLLPYAQSSLYSGLPWERFSASSTKRAVLAKPQQPSTSLPASPSRD